MTPWLVLLEPESPLKAAPTNFIWGCGIFVAFMVLMIILLAIGRGREHS
ncbi:MAG: hypothetical protein ACRDPH_03295 [Marmoricola sp.]